MNKKIVSLLLAGLLIALPACDKEVTSSDYTGANGETTITATGDLSSSTEESDFSFLKNIGTITSATGDVSGAVMNPEESEEQVLDENAWYSPEEVSARKSNQISLANQRNALYGNAPTPENSFEIFKLDQQIIENNAFDFRTKNIVFIGDSITQGVQATVDSEGKPISYVNYVNDSLSFNKVLNHGVGGRMFGRYGGDEMSISANFDNVINIDSDIIVVFAGINDYLSGVPNKRFGNVNDSISTAGYCGELRSFMKKLQSNFGDKDIFFVLMYPVSYAPDIDYSDASIQPDLATYIQVERQLAEEYGFNIIDLYSTGIMDGTVPSVDYAYLADSLHPNDFGYCILGRHIAAELSLYFSQNKTN